MLLVVSSDADRGKSIDGKVVESQLLASRERCGCNVSRIEMRVDQLLEWVGKAPIPLQSKRVRTKAVDGSNADRAMHVHFHPRMQPRSPVQRTTMHKVQNDESTCTSNVHQHGSETSGSTYIMYAHAHTHTHTHCTHVQEFSLQIDVVVTGRM